MLKSVAVIVVPNFSIFEFGTACEVFGIDRSARGSGVPDFDLRVCTPIPGNVRMKSGLSMNVNLGLEAAADADLVIMTPFGREEDVPESVMETLRAADARGAWVMSICSGAFALARAGLLDGRRCTTHWRYSQDLASRYPEVQVDENVLYVQDGNLITSAGTAAGIDACLHLVRVELGANVAAAIARDMVVPPHRDGGQAPFFSEDVPLSQPSSKRRLLSAVMPIEVPPTAVTYGLEAGQSGVAEAALAGSPPVSSPLSPEEKSSEMPSAAAWTVANGISSWESTTFAWPIAVSPEAQKLLTVWVTTASGKLSANLATMPMCPPCAPTWPTQPSDR